MQEGLLIERKKQNLAFLMPNRQQNRRTIGFTQATSPCALTQKP
jgi:hypothetical protein